MQIPYFSTPEEQVPFVRSCIEARHGLQVPGTAETPLGLASWSEPESLERLKTVGRHAFAEGETALLLPLGGRSTRFGTAFRPDLVVDTRRGLNLLAHHAKRLKELAGEGAPSIPWLIVTSRARLADGRTVGEAVRDSVERHKYFGLDKKRFVFIEQPVFPVLDSTLEPVRSGNGYVVAPCGHGGLIAALRASAASLQQFAQAGINFLYSFIYPNVLDPLLDPALLGLHIDQHADFTVRAMPAWDYEPGESLGRVTAENGRIRIVEYHHVRGAASHEIRSAWSDFPANTGAFWISRDFLEHWILQSDEDLPFYAIEGANGQWHIEQFVFDLLPHGKGSLFVVPRRESYCTVKQPDDLFLARRVLSGLSTVEPYERLASTFASCHQATNPLEPQQKRLIQQLGQHGRVLDAGCGPGRDLVAFVKAGLEVVGIDRSRQMVALARNMGIGTIREMDLRQLEFPPETFSAVWCNAVMHHFVREDEHLALSEIARVLMPGGIAFIAVEGGDGYGYVDDAGRWRRRYTRRMLEACIRAAGLDVVEVEQNESDTSTTQPTGKQKRWWLAWAQKPSPQASHAGDCLLCPGPRFRMNMRANLPGAGSILWGDDDFFVMPDVAPLTEGHLLIVTHKHYQCMGHLSSQLLNRLHSVARRVRLVLQEAYHQPVVIFEHGSVGAHDGGACIDHAHWHVLPAANTLGAAVAEQLGSPEAIQSPHALQLRVHRNQPYIYFADSASHLVFTPSNIPCQFLRRLMQHCMDPATLHWQWEAAFRLERSRQLFHHTLEKLLPFADSAWTARPTCSSELHLRDLGERRIVEELVRPRFLPSAHESDGLRDDCAVVPDIDPGSCLVATTDPGPTPVISMLEPLRYDVHGRYLMTVNLSDLAAAGAAPQGLLISSEMPEDMRVADYEAFLEGVASYARAYRAPILGGNVKEADSFKSTATALGAVSRRKVMRRRGAQVGDRICVVGRMGLFWSAILARLFPTVVLDDASRLLLEESLYYPTPKVDAGQLLADSAACHACMDASDGIAACIEHLAHCNGLDIVVHADALVFHPAVETVARACGIDPRILCLSWGNWELVAALDQNAVPRVEECLNDCGTPMWKVGLVEEGSGAAWLELQGRRSALPALASYRFDPLSYTEHGLLPYIEALRIASRAVVHNL